MQNCTENRSITAFNRAGFRHRDLRSGDLEKIYHGGTEEHRGKSKPDSQTDARRGSLDPAETPDRRCPLPPPNQRIPRLPCPNFFLANWRRFTTESRRSTEGEASQRNRGTQISDLKNGLSRPASGRSCYGDCELSRIPPQRLCRLNTVAVSTAFADFASIESAH